jgi:hypothetical protein
MFKLGQGQVLLENPLTKFSKNEEKYETSEDKAANLSRERTLKLKTRPF